MNIESNKMILPYQTTGRIKKVLVRAIIECTIVSILVSTSFILGLNFLFAFFLPLIVYIRDLKVFKDNAYLLNIENENNINKIFHLPYFINVISLIIVPFLLPQLILLIEEDKWSDLLKNIVVKSIVNNSLFFSPFTDINFISNKSGHLGMIMLKGSISLVFYTTVLVTFYSGLFIALTIGFNKTFLSNALSLAKYHIKNEAKTENYYLGIALFGIVYPLFITISFLLLFRDELSIIDFMIAEFSLLLLSCSVYQMITFLVSRCIKVKEKND